MNLRELPDIITEDDKEWLKSNRNRLIPDDVPDAVRWAFARTIGLMIEQDRISSI